MPRLGYKHGCETCGLLFSFGIYQSLYEDMSREENTPFTGAINPDFSYLVYISRPDEAGCALRRGVIEML
jgi:hypothetical protein